MPISRAASIHYDRVLTEVSVQYQHPGFIASVIFPERTVKKESDLWPVYDLSSFQQVDDAIQDGDIAREASWGWRLDWYRTEEHALRSLITNRQRNNVDNPIDLEVDTTKYLTEMILLNMEIAAARTVRDPASNGYVQNIADGWANYLTASPKTDITNAKNAIFRMTGRVPNVIVIPSTIASRMLLIEEIKEERKYVTDLTQSGLPNPLWGLRVVEAGALVAATYGAAWGETVLDPTQITSTSALSEAWGRDVWIGYVDEPGVRKLTYGANFMVRPRQVRSYREEAREGDWIEVRTMYGLKVIARACGALLQNVMPAS